MAIDGAMHPNILVTIGALVLALVATAIYVAIAARFSPSIHRMLVDIERSFTAGLDRAAGINLNKG